MEVATASPYDGATSAAEAISPAINKKKRHGVVPSNGFHPNTKEVINTFLNSGLRYLFLEGKILIKKI